MITLTLQLTICILAQEPGLENIRSASAQALLDSKRIEDSARMPAALRRQVLREMVQNAQEEPATDALSLLVRAGDPEGAAFASELVSRISSTKFVGRVLAVAANHFDRSDRHEIARHFLRKVRGGFAASKQGIPIISLAGYSAELLSDSELPADQTLIQNLWENCPEELGYLNALMSLGVRPGNGLTLAYSLYSNLANQLWVRVAAAGILAPQDKQAAAFCAAELENLLAEFGSRDGMELLMDKGSQTTQRITLPKMPLPIPMFSVLQHLKTADAERLTFGHLESRNLWQNRALGLLAAERWPQHLIDATLVPDEDRKQVLATLCVMHPKLESEVKKLFSGDEFSKYLVAANAVGVQGLPALAFNPSLVFFRK